MTSDKKQCNTFLCKNLVLEEKPIEERKLLDAENQLALLRESLKQGTVESNDS